MRDSQRFDTGANQELTSLAARLEARGVRCRVTAAGNVKVPRTGLEPHERALIAAHKREFVGLLRAREKERPRPAKPAPRPPEPEPVVYAYRGRRVSEGDVLECLRRLGDQTLADYRSGELLKGEAYEMTRAWLREIVNRR